jgi:hypothetical protein
MVEADELEALGGDPFFLDVDDDLTERKGDEDHYPGDRRPGADTRGISSILSSDVLASKPTISTSRVQTRMAEPATTDSDVDDHEPSLEELEALGGDPFFLGSMKEAMGGDMSAVVAGPMPATMELDGAINRAFLAMSSERKGPYDTALEGESFASSAEELEALGGDPFFFGSDDGDGDDDYDADHLDKAPSEEMINADPSFLLQYAQIGRVSPESPSFDGLPSGVESVHNKVNERKMSKALSEEEELLEMGGDPSFLATYYDQSSESGGNEYEHEKDRVEELGGDPFFL